MSRLPAEITVSDGRVFALREATPGNMLDLIEAAGTAAGSGAWMRYALMVVSVTAIDGKPVVMPATKQGMRQLADRIGNSGMEALAAVHYPDAGEASPDGAVSDELATAKN